MRFLLTGVAALSFAISAHAQLAPPNSAGVTFGHVHLNVADIELHKKLWVEHFGGTVVVKGPLTVVKFPNMLLALTERSPTGDSEGTVMDHFGFKVRDIESVKKKWREAGYDVTAEFTGAEGFSNAYLVGPDEVKIELQEDDTMPIDAKAHHIHFFTSEYVELMDWYVDLFSLEPRARGSIKTTAYASAMNLSFANSRTPRAATRGRVIDHIGFEVDDLKAFCEMLEARGITFDVPYREVPSIELKIAFFTDPSGVYIELTEGYDKY